jgi:multidrug efflux pump subunit AcrA (membrane-fusion protein)
MKVYKSASPGMCTTHREQTDTLIMRATIPNPDGLLIDGQFVTAEIRERREELRLVIPQAYWPEQREDADDL